MDARAISGTQSYRWGRCGSSTSVSPRTMRPSCSSPIHPSQRSLSSPISSCTATRSSGQSRKARIFSMPIASRSRPTKISRSFTSGHRTTIARADRVSRIRAGLAQRQKIGGYERVVTENRDGRRCNTTVYHAPSPRGGHHPTEKPTELLAWLVGMYTRPGEVVLDNCMGSGSTGVACCEMGRDFIGIERDEKYFEIAKERIESVEKA